MSSFCRQLLPFRQLPHEISSKRGDCSNYHHCHDRMPVILGRVLYTEGPLVLVVFFSRASGHWMLTLFNRLARRLRRLRIILLQRGVVVNFGLLAGTGAWGFAQDRTELGFLELENFG